MLICLRKENFNLQQIPGDGNCLFSSKAHILNNGKTAADIRREIVAFVANPDENFELGPAGVSWTKWRCLVKFG